MPLVNRPVDRHAVQRPVMFSTRMFLQKITKLTKNSVPRYKQERTEGTEGSALIRRREDAMAGQAPSRSPGRGWLGVAQLRQSSNWRRAWWRSREEM